MRPRYLFFILVLLVLVPVSFAVEDYKPYLHKPEVADHPEIILYGQYRTNMFPGAATYSYPIQLPEGTNDLKPSIVITYNSQSATSDPGIIGAGWSLNMDHIEREINSTPGDSSDDEFILVLDGTPYQLVLDKNGQYRTEVDYHFKIEKLTGASNEEGEYWEVTKRTERNTDLVTI